MLKRIIIVKNSSGQNQVIPDLGGVVIPNGGQVALSDNFNIIEISKSRDLKTLVNSGDLVINNNVGDLNSDSGLEYLTLINRYNLYDRILTDDGEVLVDDISGSVMIDEDEEFTYVS